MEENNQVAPTQNAQPEIQSPPEQRAADLTPPKETPKKNPSIFVPLLVICLFITLGTTGYFWYQNYLIKNQKTTTSPPPELPINPTETVVNNLTDSQSDTLQDSLTPTTISTTNWITYTVDAFTFEIKYPQEWIILSESVHNNTVPYQLRLTTSDRADSIKLSQNAGEIVNLNSDLYPLVEINITKDDIQSAISKTQKLKNTPDMFLSTQLDTKIAEYYGKELNLIDGERNYGEKWIIFLKDSFTFSIRLVSTNPMDIEETNKILATFKFIK